MLPLTCSGRRRKPRKQKTEPSSSRPESTNSLPWFLPLILIQRILYRMLDKSLNSYLKGIIDQVRQNLAGKKVGSLEVAHSVMDTLHLEDLERHPMRRDQIALEFIRASVERSDSREKKAELRANPKQAWLDLPDLKDFQHIPVIAGKDSLEEFRERIATKKREIKAYKRPRLSSPQEQILKLEVRDMERIEPKIAPYFANDPTMTVERAVGLYQETVTTLGPSQRRKAQAREAAKRAKRART